MAVVVAYPILDIRSTSFLPSSSSSSSSLVPSFLHTFHLLVCYLWIVLISGESGVVVETVSCGEVVVFHRGDLFEGFKIRPSAFLSGNLRAR